MLSFKNKINKSFCVFVSLYLIYASAFAIGEYKNISQAEQGMNSSCLDGLQIIKTNYGEWTLVSNKKIADKARPVSCTDKEKNTYRFGNTEFATKDYVLRYAYPSSSNYIWVLNLKIE